MAKRIYSAIAHVAGGRRGGTASSSDGHLSVKLDAPPELGGRGAGANPEQLLAAGWAACFTSAIELVAARRKRGVGPITADAEVALVAQPDRSFGLEVALHFWAEELTDLDEAVDLVREAHKICPYSNATRGNVPVELSINGRHVSH